MPRIRKKAKVPSVWTGGPVSLSMPVQTINLTPTPPVISRVPGSDIAFIAGHREETPDGLFGTHGCITWTTVDGPTLVLHGGDSEHMFTLERDGEILFSIPKAGPATMVHEIVQREIRLVTVASIKEAVERELNAVKGYGEAASKVAADLEEMGFNGEK